MSTAFGALIRYRRRSLHLTQATLAQRMALQGQEIGIAPLENGLAAVPQRDTLDALTAALEWPTGILDLVSGGNPAPTIDPDSNSRQHSGTFTEWNLEQLILARAELASLRNLHDALQQWMDDLDARIQGSLVTVPLRNRVVRFDD